MELFLFRNKIMNRIIIGLALVLMSSGVMAQDECEYEPSDKVAKILEKASNKKKYSSDERYDFFVDALDREEECLPCLHQLGYLSFLKAKNNQTSFTTAENYLNQLIGLCEEYHSDPYYYLGAINYANQNYDQALTYFEKYLHFPDDDPEKFKKDYDKKYIEVEEAIPSIEFWKEFYENDGTLNPKKVEGVSTASDELLPTISPDGEIMFYSRRLMKQAKGDLYAKKVEQFTWSKRDDINSLFDEGDALPKPFNMGDSYGAATISVDNKEMIIAVKNPVGSNPDNFDLFETSYQYVYDETEGKKIYKWTDLEILSENVNSDASFESQPSLSGDGKYLFFCSVRPESMTRPDGNFSHDLFYCERQDGGSWGKAKNLGPVINTPGEEKSPFMHSDSKTLYFASSGHKGRGGMDIFYSKMNDDGTWEKPKNIGHPINTGEDESGLVVSADGEEAYFFSKRIQGSGGFDIYSIPLPEKAKPEKVMILKGEMKDEKDKPVQDARIEIKYADSKKIDEIKVDNSDGKYAAVVNIEKQEDIIMNIKKEGTAFQSKVIKTAEEEAPSVVEVDVQTYELKKNKPFVINDIYYKTNSSDIDPESKLILDEFAAYLLENPNMYIEIRGHTDNLGSDKDNLALSMDRAFEVKGYLEKQGVEGKRVTAKGYGESMPVADNNTEEGKAKNRRTEFVVTKM